MATRIDEILQFNKCLNQFKPFSFHSINLGYLFKKRPKRKFNLSAEPLDEKFLKMFLTNS